MRTSVRFLPLGFFNVPWIFVSCCSQIPITWSSKYLWSQSSPQISKYKVGAVSRRKRALQYVHKVNCCEDQGIIILHIIYEIMKMSPEQLLQTLSKIYCLSYVLCSGWGHGTFFCKYIIRNGHCCPLIFKYILGSKRAGWGAGAVRFARAAQPDIFFLEWGQAPQRFSLGQKGKYVASVGQNYASRRVSQNSLDGTSLDAMCFA